MGQKRCSCWYHWPCAFGQGKAAAKPRSAALHSCLCFACLWPQVSDVQPQLASSPLPPLHEELILIVDCSGSMQGSRAQQAKEAALYFIKVRVGGASASMGLQSCSAAGGMP